MIGKLISYVIVLLIGFAGAIGYHQLNSNSESQLSFASQIQSITGESQDPLAAPLASSDIDLPGITGTIKVYREGDFRVVRIVLESDEPSEIHGQLAEPWSTFSGFSNRSPGDVAGFIFAQGKFTVAQSTSKDVTIVISTAEDVEFADDNHLRFAVTQDGEILLRETVQL